MAMAHSPRQTRSRTPAPASAENEVLRTVLAELQQLREERRQDRDDRNRFQAEMEAQLRSRDESLRRLEERIAASNDQLSPSSFLPGPSATEPLGVACSSTAERGYIRFKTDTYDGSAPLREFLAQFCLVARANGWGESAKAVALASCLRGRARSVLDSAEDEEAANFDFLKSKLELLFGESKFAQDRYMQFVNRRQKPGEDFATLGADLERLSRLAYSECSPEVRDKIACSQFVAALTDSFIKRSLQMEGIITLKGAIERAKTIRAISENSFSRRNGNGEKGGTNGDSHNKAKAEEGKKEAKKQFFSAANNARREKECWQCGARGHFRAECPKAGNSATPN